MTKRVPHIINNKLNVYNKVDMYMVTHKIEFFFIEIINGTVFRMGRK